jgi:hypothetical protein
MEHLDVVRRVAPLVALCAVLAACSGGGGGGAAAPTAPGVGVIPGATPTPSPGAGTPTPTPTPKATATPTPIPTPTATSTAAAIAAACQQTQSASGQGTISPTTTTPFLATVAAAQKICMSAYVFTTVAFNALDAAAKNHATVVVVFPQEEQSYYTADLAQLQTDGAIVVIDPGAPTNYPIHAKLAVVDGYAYLDGHNWVESNGAGIPDDVIIKDTVASDFTAIESALMLNPISSASGNLDTLKVSSQQMEATFLTANSALVSATTTVNVMTESFSSGDGNLVSALEAAGQTGAKVNVILVGGDETGSSADMSLIGTMAAAPYGITFWSNVSSGSEKVLSISSVPGEVWYGSANATSTSSMSSNYIDWGMLVTDPPTIAAINAYYAQQLSVASSF